MLFFFSGSACKVFYLRAKSERFHQKYLDMHPLTVFRHRFLVRLTQVVVMSLFPDRCVACTRSDRRLRDTPYSSSLVCGSWWWFVVVGCCWGSQEMAHALHASTQAMAGSFPAKAMDVFFLFGFVYSYLFTVYLYNGLILYGLLGGF